MIHYERCPFCGSADIQLKFSAKDYTVSGESFPIFTCRNCSGGFTQDVPDAADIGAYYASENYISHSDTAKGLVNRLYHRIRKITLQQKRCLIEKETNTSQAALLDIGCGTGAFLHTMQQAGWAITGLEPDEKARQLAEKNYGLKALPAPELFNLQPASFDAITMWHVLEHVHDLHAYLDQLKKLLKPGAVLFVAVPNYTSADAAHYQQYWAAYDVPRHLYHFSPASMKALMAAHDLEVVNNRPMWFDSFYVSMLSQGYRSGKPGFIGAMLQGLFSNINVLLHKEKCSSVIYIIKAKAL